MRQERNHIDLMTLIAVLTLMVLSLGIVYSAGATWFDLKPGGSGRLLVRHAVKVMLGILAIFIVMHIDYRTYRKITKPAVLVSICILVITLLFGGEVKGASRWLQMGGFSFQPSEFAKYALIFHLCTLIATKRELIRNFKTGFLPMMVWIGAVTGLVLLQPNFSTGAMILVISLTLLFVGRAKWTHIALTFAALMPVLVVYVLSAPYRMQRIMSFLGGGGATAELPYQLRQGIIGFGNGGLFGLGPGGSRQRELFLPESYGDFIFSIVGEEYGLIGTLFVLALFLAILLRGMKIARSARDDFGRTLAFGITATIALYALINAGVTLGILPTTGLPMPFVSYGGSSMLFSSVAVGVLLNISSQTDLHPRIASAPEGIRPIEPIGLQGKANV